jgi:hypothetical protein
MRHRPPVAATLPHATGEVNCSSWIETALDIAVAAVCDRPLFRGIDEPIP